jgi:hypothetical protein
VLPDGKARVLRALFLARAGGDEEAHDYIDETTTVANATIPAHPLGAVILPRWGGMTFDWLHEHDAVTRYMFDVLVKGADGLWRWPDKAWLPLAFSLRATRR